MYNPDYEGKAIAFAFYKNNEFIGYRLDTVGSVRKEAPKIYTYSQSQVETVIKNITHNVTNPSGFGNILKQIAGEDSYEANLVADTEQAIHDMFQDKRAFEVRVVIAPEYPTEFSVEKAKYVRLWEYPIEEVKIWMQDPNDHEVIETYYFSMDGLINLQ